MYPQLRSELKSFLRTLTWTSTVEVDVAYKGWVYKSLVDVTQEDFGFDVEKWFDWLMNYEYQYGEEAFDSMYDKIWAIMTEEKVKFLQNNRS